MIDSIIHAIMLYELIGIVSPGMSLDHTRDLYTTNINYPGPTGQLGRSQRVSKPQHLHHYHHHHHYQKTPPQPVKKINNSLTHLHRIAKTSSTQILAAGGVVRGITNWGIFRLPKPARKHKTLHHNGHYFIVRFDSSARTQHAVRRTLGLDPRMIRYSVVKVGSTLEEIQKVGGKVEWGGRESI